MWVKNPNLKVFIFLVLFVFCWAGLIAEKKVLAVPVGIQEFFLPLPTGDVINSGTFAVFNAIEPPLDPGPGMYYLISVIASADDTTIYYDHWENGLGTGAEADEIIRLDKGEVHLFENGGIPVPRGNLQFYDGGDRILVAGSLLQLVVTTWTEHSGPDFADSWEIYPTAAWDETYDIPVGEDLAGAPLRYRDFSFVYAFVMSSKDGNEIVITDPDGPGLSTTLDRGETAVYKVRGAGAMVRGMNAQYPVQVQLMTGRRDSVGAEMRGYTLMPRALWGTRYCAPVPSVNRGNSDLFVFNPSEEALDVRFEDLSGAGTFTVQPGKTLSYSDGAGRFVPEMSGVLLDADSIFWAIGSGGSGSGFYDWGYSLIPAQFLGTDTFVSWAPGTFDLSGNGSPVFISATEDGTTVSIDYGPSDGVIDDTFMLDRLMVLQVFDPDDDNTGMHIMSDRPVATAWGENAEESAISSPYLDMGYTVLPLAPEFIDLNLTTNLTVDLERVRLGETATFTVDVSLQDDALADMTDMVLVLSLPPGWEYIFYVPDSSIPAESLIITGDLENGFVLTWDLEGSLSPGESLTYQVHARPTSSADLTELNQTVAEISGQFLGLTITTEDDAVNEIVDITSTKTASGERVFIAWEVRWTNRSGSDVFIHMEDSIPENTTYRNGSLSADFGSFSYDSDTDSIIWEGQIPGNGGEVVIHYQTRVPNNIDEIENLACAFWDRYDDGDWVDDREAGQAPICSNGGIPTVYAVPPWPDFPAMKPF